MLALSSVGGCNASIRARRITPACIYALALIACGDGVGRPIVELESGEELDAGGEPLDEDGLDGSAGDDAGSFAVDSGTNQTSEEYCAAVEAWPTTEANIEDQLVSTINGVRVLGLGCEASDATGSPTLLTHDPRLRCAARVHTRDMIERDYFDDVNPEGEGPEVRIARAGYPVGLWAEVIGQLDLEGGPEGFVDFLTENGEGCEVPVDERFDAVGVGYYQGVWTVVLAGPLQISP